MTIRIRKAKKEDLKRIMEIEMRSYIPQLRASKEVLQKRFETFGIRVAELNGKVVGFYTCVPARIPFRRGHLQTMLQNRSPDYSKWFDAYKKGGKFNALLVTSTAVESQYQNQGVGKAMIQHSLRLAKTLGLTYRISALRCQFARYHERTGKGIESYLQRIRSGRERDRFLAPYLRLGIQLGKPLPNYEPPRGSRNYNVFAYKRIK